MKVIRPGEPLAETKQEQEDKTSTLEEEPIQKEVVLKENSWYLAKATEKKGLLDNMVSEWNSIIIPYNMRMFEFCSKLTELRKQFEHESFATIIREFSRHPNIRHPPSPGRIWQYLKLIENKPKLIDAMKHPEKKENKSEFYYKKDGSIFAEFYIELYGGRHSLPLDVAKALERRGRREKWSYRKLIEKIHEAREDTDLMTNNEKLEKASLLRKIIGRLKGLSVDQLRELYSKIENAKKM